MTTDVLIQALDAATFEALAERAVAGEVEAWSELVERLWPELTRLVQGSRSMGPLARSEDHVRSAVLRIIGKLERSERRALRLYPAWRAARPDSTHADWLRIVSTNAVRDYVRERLGAVSKDEKTSGLRPVNKRMLDSLATMLPDDDAFGTRPRFTDAQTARQLMEVARARLPEAQYAALTSWISGATFEEISSELKLESPEAANRLVRAAQAMLRREFAA
jgi:DNA-directed RNA polymerase specialized sigma24 family protein